MKLSWQAAQNHRCWPSSSPCEVSFLKSLNPLFFAFAGFETGAGALPVAACSPPSTDQKRHPLHAEPPMTAEPADDGLMYRFPSSSRKASFPSSPASTV